MKRPKLKLEDLSVESFATTPTRTPGLSGTIFGQDTYQTGPCCNTRYLYFTCQEYGATCAGPDTCYALCAGTQAPCTHTCTDTSSDTCIDCPTDDTCNCGGGTGGTCTGYSPACDPNGDTSPCVCV